MHCIRIYVRLSGVAMVMIAHVVISLHRLSSVADAELCMRTPALPHWRVYYRCVRLSCKSNYPFQGRSDEFHEVLEVSWTEWSVGSHL